jgi:hypothetical protein
LAFWPLPLPHKPFPFGEGSGGEGGPAFPPSPFVPPKGFGGKLPFLEGKAEPQRGRDNSVKFIGYIYNNLLFIIYYLLFILLNSDLILYSYFLFFV